MQQGEMRTYEARVLRQVPTAAERALWEAVRARRFRGLKIRLQVPVGVHVAPFLCSAERLVIALYTDGRVDRAGARRFHEDMRAAGYRVLWLEEGEVVRDALAALARWVG